jgi:hypothetical protein
VTRWCWALVALVLVAGCGVGGQGGVHDVAKADVPFGLLRDDVPTVTTAPSGAVGVQIYLVGASGLAAVDRQVPAPVSLTRLVRLVGRGPTPHERDAGLTTSLPAPALVRDVSLSGGIATVELDAAFADLAPEEQRSALAQVVFTLTARPGIGRVSFTVGEAPVEVPRGDGSLTDESVSRDAYASFVSGP